MVNSAHATIELARSARLSARLELTDLPGSKYLANRLLVLAALSESGGILSNLPQNDDIAALAGGLRVLGYHLNLVEDRLYFGTEMIANVPASAAHGVIDCAASGTMARFVTAVAALGDQEVTITGSARLRQRPMGPLLAALRTLGAQITATGEGFLPIRVKGPIHGGAVSLPGGVSSQFASALLLVSARLDDALQITIDGEILSGSYIKMTAQLANQSGSKIRLEDHRYCAIPASIKLGSMALSVDPCSASYFFAAAVLSERPLTLAPFSYLPHLQGEFRFLELLRRMGCTVDIGPTHVCLTPPEAGLSALSVDMSDMPDVVQTLAVIAAFAHGTSRLQNIGHLRLKESNRLEDTAAELRKFGIEAKVVGDDLVIVGGQGYVGASIDPHADHRMAMALAQLAWCIDGVKLDEPGVVSKSFPQFWDKMDSIGLESRHTECHSRGSDVG